MTGGGRGAMSLEPRLQARWDAYRAALAKGVRVVRCAACGIKQLTPLPDDEPDDDPPFPRGRSWRAREKTPLSPREIVGTRSATLAEPATGVLSTARRSASGAGELRTPAETTAPVAITASEPARKAARGVRRAVSRLWLLATR